MYELKNIKASDVGIFIQEALNMLITKGSEVHGLVYNPFGIYFRTESLLPYRDDGHKTPIIYAFDINTCNTGMRNIHEAITVLKDVVYIKGKEYQLISTSEFNENKFQYRTVMTQEDMDLYELCSYLHPFRDNQFTNENFIVIIIDDFFRYYEALVNGEVHL